MIAERGCRTCDPPRSVANCAYATNSLSVALSPIRLPTYSVSAHGTPITHASGRRTKPRIDCRLSDSNPKSPPPQPSIELSSATSATNAMSIAATLIASCTPTPAPFAAASITLLSALVGVSSRSSHAPSLGGWSTSTAAAFTPAAVTGTSVSGTMILESTRPAGAFMTLAASRCAAIPGK